MDILSIAQFIVGLALLVIGADVLVRSASALARDMGISAVVVGLTVVAFGTSAPELAVSVQAALTGEGAIAVGNVVGSNIANVLLILGTAAAMLPLVVSAQVVRIDVPIMIAATVLTFLLSLNGTIDRGEGAVMSALLLGYIWLQIRMSRTADREVREEFAEEYPPDPGRRRAAIIRRIALLVAGLTVMIFGANWLVTSASAIARTLGVSELVIGLTIVAVGTSAPELATTVVATLRGQRDIAVGNVVGSNIFNLFFVLGLTALFSPRSITIPPAALAFDMPVMLGAALLCLPVFWVRYTIHRWEGIAMLAFYASYIAYLLLQATHHDALGPFSFVMAAFVLPLAALGVVFSVVMELRRKRRDRVREQTVRPGA